jgi:hypothetical protein
MQSYAYDEGLMLVGIAAYRKEFPGLRGGKVEALRLRGEPRAGAKLPVCSAEQAESDALRVAEPVHSRQPRKRMTSRERRHIRALIEAVAEDFGLPVVDMSKRTNLQAIVLPRQIAMHLISTETEASSGYIADMFHKHHTTALHGMQRVAALMKSNQALRTRIERIIAVANSATDRVGEGAPCS